MKRILLLVLLGVFVSTTSFSQVVCFVYPPAGSTGSYNLNYATIDLDWTLMPDLTDPANNVIDTLAIVDDGVEPNNDGCEDLINPEDIDGKIAMVWRGACQFGTKAIHCQDAGAVAVIIVNNVGDDVTAFNMLAGDEGPDVTIPVIMIDQASGELIADEINGGATLTALIGQISGAFANNVGSWDGNYIRTKGGAQLANAGSLEDDMQIGTWVKNYGTSEMPDVIVTASIFNGDNTIYEEVAAGVTIAEGDSAYVSFPDFTGSLGAVGIYSLNYDIAIPVEDEFADDNNINVKINVNNDNFAYCRVDDDNVLPVTMAGYQPNDMGSDDTFSECIVYKESNASDYTLYGITYAASTNSEFELTGHLISTSVYAWSDEFVDMDDDNLAFEELEQIASLDYEYGSDLQDEYITTLFDAPVELEDDVRYLLCATSFTNEIFLGFDSGMEMGLTLAAYNQPYGVTEVNGEWFAAGFGTDVTPTVVGNFSLPNNIKDVSLVEELIAYPNPAIDVISIPLVNSQKVVAVDVYDTNGKLVLTQNSIQNWNGLLSVDISILSNGLYSFSAVFEDGKTSSFNVVVNK